MNNIAIITDSTSDIPVSLAEEYGIIITPLYIGFEGKLYKEGKTITNEKIYEKLEAGVKINTSAPPTGDFVNIFRDLIEKKGKNLIYCIHLSSKLSGAFNSANQAKKFFPQAKIKVIDSKNVTLSLGLIVLEAARAAREGKSEEEIDSLIESLIKKSKFFATIENFEYLFKGGRAPFLGKLLSKSIIFKLIITIDKNGKIKPKKIVRNRRNVFIEFCRQVKKASSSAKKVNIGIFYGSDKKTALELEKLIRDDSDTEIDEIILTEITAIISAHTGPGICGIAVCPKAEY